MEFDEPDNLFSNERNPSAIYSPSQATTDYIQLRFQLARFQVYRFVRLPLTFTFANLHILIQYMFGWSDSHLHHAEVYPNAVLHDEEELSGTIKSCGRKRALESYELGDPRAIADWQRFEPADKPIYRVQPKVKHRIDKIDPNHVDGGKGANNVSDGQCSNAQVAIIYTYDFGEEWTVHITCEQGNIFHHLDTPNSLPIFGNARGAPPLEHATWDADAALESDADEKDISPRLFDPSYFQGYCEGKITSEARRTKLEILTLEERKAQQEEYLRRKKEKQREKEERIADGEMDEDEDGDDSDLEYGDFYDAE